MSVTDDITGTMLLDNINAPTYSALASNGNLRNFFYGVLPIEFQSFNATPTTKGVSLKWLVSQDKADAFTIERSVDAKIFEGIGSVKVTSHSGTPQYFTFNDDKPAALTAYYRIKSTDLAGKEVYSKSLAVSSYFKGDKVKVYPNPAGTEGYINVETVSDIRSIAISNTLGQVVLTSTVSRINIAHLAKGLYNVTVKTSEGTMLEKFFKL